MVSVIAVWFDPTEDDAPHREWAKAAWQKLQAEKAGNIITLRVYNLRAQSRRVERIPLGDAAQ